LIKIQVEEDDLVDQLQVGKSVELMIILWELIKLTMFNDIIFWGSVGNN
jgi:hypothetical protein